MSDAQVKFLTIEGDLCRADEKPQRFTFRCVNRNRDRPASLDVVQCANLLIADAGHGIKRDAQGKDGGRPQWNWNGDRERPTFSPSINCSAHCGWHGYIENGRCVDTARKDEP